jgi:L-lactate dehydrogenase (cytochrome)
MTFPNVKLAAGGPMPYADMGRMLDQAMVSWQDLRWIRDAWKGPIVIKGVHTGEDARRSADEEADASSSRQRGRRHGSGRGSVFRTRTPNRAGRRSAASC